MDTDIISRGKYSLPVSIGLNQDIMKLLKENKSMLKKPYSRLTCSSSSCDGCGSFEYDTDELDFEYEDNPSVQLQDDITPNNFCPPISSESPNAFDSATSRLKAIQQSFIKIENGDDEYHRDFLPHFDEEEMGESQSSQIIDSESEEGSESGEFDGLSSKGEDSLLKTDSSDAEEESSTPQEEEEELLSLVPVVRKRPAQPTAATNFTITINNYTNERYLKKRLIRKKPWTHKPYTISNRILSSNDIIKYTPDDELIPTPDHESRQSPRPTNFIIQLGNNDKRVVNSSNNNNSPFKMPLKRPPTRQSLPKHSTDIDRRISNDSLSIVDISDDAISIIGSESITGFEAESDNINTTFMPESRLKEEVLSEFELTSVKSQKSDDTPVNVLTVIPEVQDKVRQWMASTAPSGPLSFDYHTVPIIFRGICYYHFLAQGCKRSQCKLPHVMPLVRFESRMENVPNAELIEAYKYSLQYPKLHMDTFKVFASEFTRRNMDKEAVDIIEDLFKVKTGRDLATAVDYILKELEKNLAFKDAVEFIIIQIGRSKLPSLDKILINVILSRTNLTEHWPTIRKLLIGKTELDVEVASNIIGKLIMVFPIDKRLWSEIYYTLIRNGNKGLVDRDQISKDLLDPLELVVLKNTSPEYQQQRSHNFIMFPSSSNPRYVAEMRRFSDTDERVMNQRVRRSSFSSVSTEEEESTVGTSYLNTDSDSTQNNTPHSSARQSVERNNQNAIETDFDRLFRTTDRQEMQYVPEVKKRKTSELKKPPINPVFGNLRLKQDYILDGSLHNFYTTDISKVDKVDIDETDVVELNRAIKSADGKQFLQILKKYNGPATVQSFISMSLAHLRGLKHQVCRGFSELLMSIDSEEPNYWNLRHTRVILEVIAMNLVLYLSRKRSWNDSSLLLQRFTDWDSLVTSMIFTRTRISMMGRYIFLAKVFANAKMFNFVFEILQHPRLNLLKHFNSWPLFCNKKNDIEQRNEVLREFFKQGYIYNIECISQMYKQIFQCGDIYSYSNLHHDSIEHFNPMITTIVNSNLNIPIKGLSLDLDIFYKVMSKENLRAFIIQLYRIQEGRNLFKYYEMGMKRDIFPKITGHEDSIGIRTDMLDEEFEMILKCYFQNRIARLKKDLKIDIGLPNNSGKDDIEMLRINRSIVEVNKSVVNILSTIFNIHEVETPWPMVIKVKSSVLDRFS